MSLPFCIVRKLARLRSPLLGRNHPVSVNRFNAVPKLREGRNAFGPTKLLPIPVAVVKSSARSVGDPEIPEPGAPHNAVVGVPVASLRTIESAAEPELAVVVPTPSLNSYRRICASAMIAWKPKTSAVQRQAFIAEDL
jgi:hypothetical protein